MGGRGRVGVGIGGEGVDSVGVGCLAVGRGLVGLLGPMVVLGLFHYLLVVVLRDVSIIRSSFPFGFPFVTIPHK